MIYLLNRAGSIHKNTTNAKIMAPLTFVFVCVFESKDQSDSPPYLPN